MAKAMASAPSVQASARKSLAVLGGVNRLLVGRHRPGHVASDASAAVSGSDSSAAPAAEGMRRGKVR